MFAIPASMLTWGFEGKILMPMHVSPMMRKSSSINVRRLSLMQFFRFPQGEAERLAKVRLRKKLATSNADTPSNETDCNDEWSYSR